MAAAAAPAASLPAITSVGTLIPPEVYGHGSTKIISWFSPPPTSLGTPLSQRLEPLHLAVGFMCAENNRLHETAQESHPPRPIRVCFEVQAGSTLFRDEQCDRLEPQAKIGVGSGAIPRRPNRLQHCRVGNPRSTANGIGSAGHVAPAAHVANDWTARLPLGNPIQFGEDVPDQLRLGIDPD